MAPVHYYRIQADTSKRRKQEAHDNIVDFLVCRDTIINSKNVYGVGCV